MLLDITASALAASSFVQDTLDFRYDTNCTQVWHMLQALVTLIEISALNAALSFMTTLISRRDSLFPSHPPLQIRCAFH